MTASSASKTHPVVNAITMECSQVLVDNPVAEIKDDTATAEDTLSAVSIVVVDKNSKKRASPESKDDPEAKKLDGKHETGSNGDNDADQQVATTAIAKDDVVVTTNDDESRAIIDIASNDGEILPATGIETESGLNESECQEECNDIPVEEINASAVGDVVVVVATEDEVECCA